MIFHSAFEYIYLWLPLIGLLVGLISTLIGGGGGGFFFIPILTILFGVPAHIAVTTSLAATIPICIVGLIG
ncbi:MAG TPA: sulfite exporter TauE/SafE family protein, partial [Bacteroidaceae bacterium]|nr:sulfite exporter TauE/SafE family protein [Bacteroidaceae bacterium]